MLWPMRAEARQPSWTVPTNHSSEFVGLLPSSLIAECWPQPFCLIEWAVAKITMNVVWNPQKHLVINVHTIYLTIIHIYLLGNLGNVGELVWAECLRQRNGIAIILGIIPHSSSFFFSLSGLFSQKVELLSNTNIRITTPKINWGPPRVFPTDLAMGGD